MPKSEYTKKMIDVSLSSEDKLKASKEYIKFLEAELEHYIKKCSDSSWRGYVDRASGAFDEDEINDTGWH